ncbi:MAG: hypothetical protein M1818_001928 [Claussenomyces sp. TS43310]|nr:MAG: hypothetical protein M1818_001928 [Claussenomyces sp. TS43310]
MPPRLQFGANALRQVTHARPTASQQFHHLRPCLSLVGPRQRIIAGEQQQQQQRPSPPIRTFTTSGAVAKKGGKPAKKESSASGAEEGADAHDFSSLEAGIERALEKLKSDLSKLRTGGRFNPELLENVRVHVSKDPKSSIRLGDLAQVLPKGGRSVAVVVGEKDHVKPIISAIQGSPDLNLQPQPDPHNPSQLNVPIPPPTKESRDLALAAATKAGEAAGVGVRNARGAMQKRLRAMELKKVVRPDDLKKAHKEMEKVVEKGVADIKKTVDAARKAMEQ